MGHIKSASQAHVYQKKRQLIRNLEQPKISHVFFVVLIHCHLNVFNVPFGFSWDKKQKKKKKYSVIFLEQYQNLYLA